MGMSSTWKRRFKCWHCRTALVCKHFELLGWRQAGIRHVQEGSFLSEIDSLLFELGDDGISLLQHLLVLELLDVLEMLTRNLERQLIVFDLLVLEFH